MSCYFCDSPATSLCPECGCGGCSTRHLALHSRGGECQPWRVGRVTGAGRGLFARRKITAGEVVLRDWPLVEAGTSGKYFFFLKIFWLDIEMWENYKDSSIF